MQKRMLYQSFFLFRISSALQTSYLDNRLRLLLLLLIMNDTYDRSHRYVSIRFDNFFFKFLMDTCPFMGPLIPLFWTSGDVCLQFQSQGGTPHLHASSLACNGILRFTSGVTSADLLEANMAAKSFQSTFL